MITKPIIDWYFGRLPKAHINLNFRILVLKLIYTHSTDLAVTKSYLYNFEPLKPHFYIYKNIGVYRGIRYCSYFWSKQGFWVHIRTASARRFKRVPSTYVLSRNMKNKRFFLSDFFFIFLVVKTSIYLNRRVFVMTISKRKRDSY